MHFHFNGISLPFVHLISKPVTGETSWERHVLSLCLSSALSGALEEGAFLQKKMSFSQWPLLLEAPVPGTLCPAPVHFLLFQGLAWAPPLLGRLKQKDLDPLPSDPGSNFIHLSLCPLR